MELRGISAVTNAWRHAGPKMQLLMEGGSIHEAGQNPKPYTLATSEGPKGWEPLLTSRFRLYSLKLEEENLSDLRLA